MSNVVNELCLSTDWHMLQSHEVW